MSQALRNVLICSVCQQPVALESSKTDENGRATHEDCYIQHLLASLHEPPSTQHAE